MSLFYLATISLILLLVSAIELLIGRRKIRKLSNTAPTKLLNEPRVSVLIPARNEEKHIEEALSSVLNQDYTNLEVIVADDRSTDLTGAVLDRMAKFNQRLKVVHITALPTGWLGKNYALYHLTKQATGDYLLFSDADIVMEPSTIRRAVNYLVETDIDHLAVGPEVKTNGFLLGVLVGYFGMMFSLFAKPWKASDPKSEKFIGIGAFNMLKSSVYEAIGTHYAIRMRPDDDMKLGKLVKKHGFRQELLQGKDLLCVEWYASASEMVRGLEKNSFAGIDYSLITVLFAAISQITLFIWPFFALIFTEGATQIVNTAIVLTTIFMYLGSSTVSGTRRYYSFAFPIAAALFTFIILNSTVKTLVNNGISWRGTHYPLSELKANKV